MICMYVCVRRSSGAETQAPRLPIDRAIFRPPKYTVKKKKIKNATIGGEGAQRTIGILRRAGNFHVGEINRARSPRRMKTVYDKKTDGNCIRCAREIAPRRLRTRGTVETRISRRDDSDEFYHLRTILARMHDHVLARGRVISGKTIAALSIIK